MRRIALAFAIAACTSPAFAAQDRYGPPRTEEPLGARAAPVPAGSMLTWHGKTAIPQAANVPAAEERPEPLLSPAQHIAPPQPPVQPPVPQRSVMAPPTAVPQRAVMAPLPAAPPTARVLPPAASPAPPYGGRVAAAPPIATAQAAGATGRPRFYSVARQYGAQPDPIPVAPPPHGPALTLNEIPTSENLGRSQAPLDDGRATQAVPTPVTKENAAASRFSRMGL